jgi:hypothetical protein
MSLAIGFTCVLFLGREICFISIQVNFIYQIFRILPNVLCRKKINMRERTPSHMGKMNHNNNRMNLNYTWPRGSRKE